LSNQNIISKWILNPDLNFQYNKSSNIWSDSNHIYLQFNDSDNVSVEPVYYAPQFGVLSNTSAFSVEIKPNKNKVYKSIVNISPNKRNLTSV